MRARRDTPSFRTPRRSICLLLAIHVLLAAGCEQGRTLGRVAGHVTLDGQACPDVMVVFQCRGEGVFITARVDKDGSYAAQMAEGHGLPLGTYLVSIRPARPRTGIVLQRRLPCHPGTVIRLPAASHWKLSLVTIASISRCRRHRSSGSNRPCRCSRYLRSATACRSRPATTRRS